MVVIYCSLSLPVFVAVIALGRDRHHSIAITFYEDVVAVAVVTSRVVVGASLVVKGQRATGH